MVILKYVCERACSICNHSAYLLFIDSCIPNDWMWRFVWKERSDMENSVASDEYCEWRSSSKALWSMALHFRRWFGKKYPEMLITAKTQRENETIIVHCNPNEVNRCQFHQVRWSWKTKASLILWTFYISVYSWPMAVIVFGHLETYSGHSAQSKNIRKSDWHCVCV